jgi:hypothetical protein
MPLTKRQRRLRQVTEDGGHISICIGKGREGEAAKHAWTSQVRGTSWRGGGLKLLREWCCPVVMEFPWNSMHCGKLEGQVRGPVVAQIDIKLQSYGQLLSPQMDFRKLKPKSVV